MPILPELSYGCLHVYGTEKNLEEDLRREVAAIYSGYGLRLVEVKAPGAPEGEAVLGEGIPALQINPSPELGEDEILVLGEDTENWVAVMSSRWEQAPVGKHPLAQALSRKFQVISVTSVASKYSEITRYENGKAAQMSLVGSAPSAPNLPSLDLKWFEGRGSAATADELRQYLDDLDTFSALAGPDLKGYRDAFEAAPLEEYPAGSHLIFRRVIS